MAGDDDGRPRRAKQASAPAEQQAMDEDEWEAEPEDEQLADVAAEQVRGCVRMHGKSRPRGGLSRRSSAAPSAAQA